LEVWSVEKLIVIEDEPLIALLLEDLASEIGWQVLGSAATECEAFDLLRSTAPTAAILDINLGPTSSFAVAAACRERGVGVVFVTGYGIEEVQHLCGDAPILAKPFTEQELRTALRRVETEAVPAS
jgi:DNA-binding response OmpR family regulator